MSKKITKAVVMILCRMLSTHVPCCHTAGFSGAEKNSFIDVGPLKSYVSGGSLTRRI